MADRISIPDWLHSEYLEGPFVECAVCSCDLTATDTIYTVSKTVSVHKQGGTETIVEMAVCMSCGDDLRNEISSESRDRITEYVASARAGRPFVFGPQAPEEAIADCLLCQKPRGECRTYSVNGHFIGTTLVSEGPNPWFPGSPVMVCDDCNLAVTEQLSQETRDTWDRFFDTYVDTPPNITLDGPRPLVGV